MPDTNTRWSRRKFLKTVGTAGMGAVLAGQNRPAAAQQPRTLPRVPTRPFGKTGQQVSILSLGGMFDIPNNQLLLKQAFKWGVTYWDTADCYGGGTSEKGIGRYFSKHPDHRKQIFLVTKSDARDPKGMTRLLNRSLKRLNTDYIDLYFIHGLKRIREINENTRKWVLDAKAAGKIRFFGFSTHSNMEKCLLDAAKLGWIDGIMLTYNYRLMHSARMKAAVNACVKAGIGLTAMKTQGGGQIRTTTETELKLAGRFLKRGFTDGQAKLKAIWENPHIAGICSQMPNLTLLMSNVAAAVDKTRLTENDTRLFRQYAAETESGYCAGCTDICEGAVENAVPIGDVMRCLMYHRSYGDFDRAATLYRSLPAEIRSRIAALDYSAAELKCPRNLAISRLMKDAAEILA